MNYNKASIVVVGALVAVFAAVSIRGGTQAYIELIIPPVKSGMHITLPHGYGIATSIPGVNVFGYSDCHYCHEHSVVGIPTTAHKQARHKPRPPKDYPDDALCANCQSFVHFRVPFGVRLEDYSAIVKCRTCGVNTRFVGSKSTCCTQKESI